MFTTFLDEPWPLFYSSLITQIVGKSHQADDKPAAIPLRP
jgi:hypothetical protein